MAGPNLPVNIDTTYSDAGDASVKLHQQYHDTVHAYVNKLDTTVLSTTNDGYVLTYDNVAGTLQLEAPVYPQRVWNSGTTSWNARPAVPAGIVVTCYSTTDVGATPPTGNQVGDIWLPHRDSAYWPT